MSERKFRRDQCPSELERAIAGVRRAFRMADSREKALLLSARILIKQAEKPAPYKFPSLRMD